MVQSSAYDPGHAPRGAMGLSFVDPGPQHLIGLVSTFESRDNSLTKGIHGAWSESSHTCSATLPNARGD